MWLQLNHSIPLAEPDTCRWLQGIQASAPNMKQHQILTITSGIGSLQREWFLFCSLPTRLEAPCTTRLEASLMQMKFCRGWICPRPLCAFVAGAHRKGEQPRAARPLLGCHPDSPFYTSTAAQGQACEGFRHSHLPQNRAKSEIVKYPWSSKVQRLCYRKAWFCLQYLIFSVKM